jgi:hypothetical protein
MRLPHLHGVRIADIFFHRRAYVNRYSCSSYVPDSTRPGARRAYTTSRGAERLESRHPGGG